MIHLGKFTEDCHLIRETAPLVHNITNYVAMELSANALLAVGASPVMSSEPAEMEDIVTACHALVINIGCLEQRQIEAMRIAASAADKQGKPWVLDPVGAGISGLRAETAMELLDRFRPAVVRGNASEILSLCGIPARSNGVDSAEDGKTAVKHAKSLALRYGTVVSISGPVDYITDGTNVISICNGNAMMPSVTAMGCTASALSAAFLAVDKNHMSAASCAMALMGVAGEKAAAISDGPGSLAVRFIDTLYSLNPEEAFRMIKL